jgi:hypothetical protein
MRNQTGIEAASELLDRWISNGTSPETDRDMHASDLITDLLLSFDADTADGILYRVTRDNTEDR